MPQQYPDWYLLEKETFKTTRKLTGLRELQYYLSNHDPYIVRLAILRLRELKLKDSVDSLRDVMNDGAMPLHIKELAAWAIKSISYHCGIDIFSNDGLLSKYTGVEEYEKLWGFNVIGAGSPMQLSTRSSIMEKELASDIVQSRFGEGVELDMPFPVKEWVSAFFTDFPGMFSNLLRNTVSLLFTTPLAAIKAMARSCRAAAISRRKVHKSAHTTKIGLKEAMDGIEAGTGIDEMEKSRIALNYYFTNEHFDSCNYIHLYKKFHGNDLAPFKPAVSAGYHIRRGFEFVLNTIAFPFKVIYAHKLLISALLIALYLLCTYTLTGKMAANKYLGLELPELSKIYSSAKDYIIDFSELLGFAKPASDTSGDYGTSGIADAETDKNIAKNTSYRVAAKSGLNIREGPGVKYGKLLDRTIKYDSVLTYLSKNSTDSSGMTWYYIETESGLRGWVWSKWLERVEL